MKTKFCPRKHRLYPEIGKSTYPYFCPKCDGNFYDVEAVEGEFDAEVAHRVDSSNGFLFLDKAGNVLLQQTTPDCHPLVWFDLEEYEEIWGKKPEYDIDILDLRGVFATGEELIWSEYRKRLTDK